LIQPITVGKIRENVATKQKTLLSIKQELDKASIKDKYFPVSKAGWMISKLLWIANIHFRRKR